MFNSQQSKSVYLITIFNPATDKACRSIWKTTISF